MPSPHNRSSNYYGTAYGSGDDIDDGYSVTAGGNYDLGVAKIYAGVQYFDNIIPATTAVATTKDTFAAMGTGIKGQIKGYAAMAGGDTPVLGGTAMFAVGFTKAEDANPGDVKAENTRIGAGVGYTYALSKRTNIYAVVGYYRDSVDNYEGNLGDDRDPNVTTALIGLRHKF